MIDSLVVEEGLLSASSVAFSHELVDQRVVKIEMLESSCSTLCVENRSYRWPFWLLVYSGFDAVGWLFRCSGGEATPVLRNLFYSLWWI